MCIEAVDHALGRGGSPPTPFATGLSPEARERRLGEALCFPDRALPAGELAEWAVALLGLDKVVVVKAAVAVVERATEIGPAESAEREFVSEVLAAIQRWLDSARTVTDLRRLAELWWSLVRNPPPAAHTPLGDAASMVWWVAAYDPEGWGSPPEEAERLEAWLRDAADNRGGIVDVFSLAQQAVAPEAHGSLVETVRSVMSAWRATTL